MPPRASRRQLLAALGHYVDEDLVLTGTQRRRAFLFELLANCPSHFKSLQLMLAPPGQPLSTMQQRCRIGWVAIR